MRHKFTITPRGKRTKYYTCQRCGITIGATSIKEANRYYPECKAALAKAEGRS